MLVALDTGEDILPAIRRVIAEEGITDGVVVSGIGSLAKARYHIVEPGDRLPWKDTFLERKGTIEILSISGLISNGEPHLHIAMSQDDQAFGGHLEEGCEVLTLAEIVILRLSGRTERIVNELGFGRLHPKLEG